MKYDDEEETGGPTAFFFVLLNGARFGQAAWHGAPQWRRVAPPLPGAMLRQAASRIAGAAMRPLAGAAQAPSAATDGARGYAKRALAKRDTTGKDVRGVRTRAI